MKIGILTFHRPCNFGANLQAFSSSSYFKKLGHDVVVINYIRDVDVEYKGKINESQFKEHAIFVCDRLPLTKEVKTISSLQDVVKEEKIELIVIGADAVWRAPKDDNVFFAQWLLDYPDISGIPVVSMSAAHMGSGFAGLSLDKRNKIRELLEKFQYVSVRDEWTRHVINRDIFNGETFVKTINPDPVFLLDSLCNDKWISHGQETNKYILMSLEDNWAKGKRRILISSWFNRFKKAVHKAGYSLVELPLPEGKSGLEFDFTVPYPIDPLQWFLWIKNARAFCGLRFHAIVSCISAGTPFFSIDKYGANTRKSYALTLLGLYKRATAHDEKSKIRNLLKDTCFEDYRINTYIENYNPSKLLNKLLGVNRKRIIELRDANIQIFDNNMHDMLAVIKNGRKRIETLKDSCTGCFACMNVCPAKAISFPENEEGFYFPCIDYKACINCGLCEQTCPVLNRTSLHGMKQAWYGWANDDDLRKRSSSGGIFGLLAIDKIKNGGVVYGAAFNYGNCFRLECRSSEDEGLEPLLKSKYVQSYVGDAFSKIKKDLEDGRKVMFCGTPCQADGLRHFLNKDYQNLLVADFVCHGVPSMAMLRDHLSMLRIKNVESIDYRPKNRNWVDDIVIKYNGGIVYQNCWTYDAYFSCFEKAGSLRRSCYNCAYCNGSRAADITLADFWGYRKYDSSIYDKRGISLALANTDKGVEYIEELKKTDSCSLKQIDTKFAEYAYSRQRNGENGYDRKRRDAFFNEIINKGYQYAVNAYGYQSGFSERMKNAIKKFIKR